MLEGIIGFIIGCFVTVYINKIQHKKTKNINNYKIEKLDCDHGILNKNNLLKEIYRLPLGCNKEDIIAIFYMTQHGFTRELARLSSKESLNIKANRGQTPWCYSIYEERNIHIPQGEAILGMIIVLYKGNE